MHLKVTIPAIVFSRTWNSGDQTQAMPLSVAAPQPAAQRPTVLGWQLVTPRHGLNEIWARSGSLPQSGMPKQEKPTLRAAGSLLSQD